MAVSGYQEAVNYILSDKDPSIDFIDNEGNYWTDMESQPVTGNRKTEEGELDIRIYDENAKININYANEDRLRKVFLFIGVPEESINEVVDSVLDWKDPDDETHLSGAENDYYEGLSDPIRQKTCSLMSGGTGTCQGMKPEYFKAGSEKSLLGLITTFGNNTVNINTVSSDVMHLLGFDENEIEAIMKQRTGEQAGSGSSPAVCCKGLNSMALRVSGLKSWPDIKTAIWQQDCCCLKQKTDAAGYKIETVFGEKMPKY